MPETAEDFAYHRMVPLAEADTPNCKLTGDHGNDFFEAL